MDYERGVIAFLHDIRTELQILNQAVRNLVLTGQAILSILKSVPIPATGGTIFQIKGGQKMAITGTPVGGSSSFQVTWNGAMAPGTPENWAVDDPNVTLSPDSSGDPTIVDATDAATDTAAIYNLTVTANNSAGSSVMATAQVQLIPPPPTPATGGTINQLT